MPAVFILLLLLLASPLAIADALLGREQALSSLLADELQAGQSFGQALAYSPASGHYFVGSPDHQQTPCLPAAPVCGGHGQVNLLRLQAGQVVDAAVLNVPNINAGAQYGYALASAGSWLAVTALWSDASGQTAGAVYLYQWQGQNWEHRQTLAPHTLDNGARFGLQLAFSANADSLVIGAPGDNRTGTGEGKGAVYVFARNASDEWQQVSRLIADDLAKGSGLGRAVAVQQNWVFAGAPDADEVGGSAGQVGLVNIYNDGNLTQTLTPPRNDIGLRFGWSLNLVGEELWVGAQHERAPDGHLSGTITRYSLNAQQQWVRQGAFGPGTGGFGHSFSRAVLAGDSATWVTASNPGDICNTDCGRALYLFDAGQSAVLQTLKRSGGERHDRYGAAIVRGADAVLVSAPTYNSGRGEVYIYTAVTDMQLHMSRTAAALAPGENYLQTVKISNTDPLSAAEQVSFSITIPPGLQVDSVLPSSLCSIASAELNCQLGDMPPAAAQTLSLQIAAAAQSAHQAYTLPAQLEADSSLLGGNPLHAVEQIWVNYPPSVQGDSQATLAESAAQGQVIARFQATDGDSDSLSFALSGEGAGQAFAINPQGEVYLLRAGVLNAAAKSTYQLLVQASDGIESAAGQALTIHISEADSSSSGGGAAGALFIWLLLVVQTQRQRRYEVS